MKGSFSNITWAVEEPFSEEEYLRAAGTYNGHKWYPKTTSVFESQRTKKDLDILRIREHEWTHYRQHISSQLGLFFCHVHNIQEAALIEYFERSTLNFNGETFPIIAKSISDNQTKLDTCIGAWKSMNYLIGTLDSHTTTIQGVITGYNTFTEVMEKETSLEGTRLSSNLDYSARSNPMNSPNIYEIVEGFAQYRELSHLIQFFPNTEALALYEIITESMKGRYASAISYICTSLNVQFFHYIVGSLLDIAIQQFKHPLYYNKEYLLWEDISPPYRLKHAVEYLVENAVILPRHEFTEKCVIDSYLIALSAFGFKGFDEFISSSVVMYPQFDISKVLCTNDNKNSLSYIKKSAEKFYSISFAGGARLRSRYPMIFAFPFLYMNDDESKADFYNITRPPIIVNKESIFIPHDLDRSEWYGFSCAVVGIAKIMLSEIARKGTCLEGENLAKKLIYSYPNYCNKIDLNKMLTSLLGTGFEEFFKEKFLRR